MRALIAFTDGDGNVWEHELELTLRKARTTSSTKLTAQSKKSEGRSAPTIRAARREGAGPDFTLPVRPFIKRYAKGASGAKRFTILVARLARGDEKVEVPFSEIDKQWNKMKVLLGGAFNPAHASRARDNGWVDSPKHAVYKLLSEWRDALPSA